MSLASINAFARLGSETITEWDESLYATTAAEMANSGNWIATTFNGQLDYYNSKPPLNVWLIALSFKLFGINIVALRLPSALAAVLTVVLLMLWLRRAYSGALALMAGLALSTSFAFFYVHSGRTANPDALFTLLVLATIVTLWSASESVIAFPFIGLLIAAGFMLRGFGALLLVALAVVGAWVRLRHVITLRLIVSATLIGVAVIAIWIAARWQLDGVTFFRAMLIQDAINHTILELEGHPGSVFFYLDVLQRYQYDWIAAAVICLLLRPSSFGQTRAWLQRRTWMPSSPLLAACGATLLIVPTLMRTKTTWYGNPLLPFLAIIVGACVVHAFRVNSGMRRYVVIAMVVIAAAVAESRLIWHSYNRRDLARSDQGLLLDHRTMLAGGKIYRAEWTRADNFVTIHLIGARHVLTVDVDEFLSTSRPGDFLLHREAAATAGLTEIGNNGRYFLYRRDW